MQEPGTCLVEMRETWDRASLGATPQSVVGVGMRDASLPRPAYPVLLCISCISDLPSPSVAKLCPRVYHGFVTCILPECLLPVTTGTPSLSAPAERMHRLLAIVVH